MENDWSSELQKIANYKLGSTIVLYGTPSAGKTDLSYAAIEMMQGYHPEAIAIRFDTDFMGYDEEFLKLHKIDRNRYINFTLNSNDSAFDRIEQEFAPMCEKGMNLKVVVIDSITSIHGKDGQTGADIIEEGFKRIWPIQRKYQFDVILTAHTRSDVDNKTVEKHMLNQWGYIGDVVNFINVKRKEIP